LQFSADLQHKFIYGSKRIMNPSCTYHNYKADLNSLIKLHSSVSEVTTG